MNLKKGLKNLKSKDEVDEKVNKKHYDIAIIGGGSGGIACAYVISKYKKLFYTIIIHNFIIQFYSILYIFIY